MTNSPISLVELRTRTQTLADGTHIIRRTRESFYRDAQGRTRTEAETMLPGTSGAVRNVSVNDPLAGKVMIWTESSSTGRKEYFTRVLRTPALLADAPPQVMPPQSGPAAQLPDVAMAPKRPQVQREDLGTHDVQGVSCKADVTTTTYPVDFFGNDRPIVVRDEHCFSRDLGRTLQQRRDDPRSGVTTITVESLTHGNPSPALFQPPPGYAERTPGTGVATPQ